MERFIRHTGVAAPLDRANVDTDQILPKQFLKRIERTGFEQMLFYSWRFLENGAENPTFVLNREPYRNATILIADSNFGSGSSREHAVWALANYGFRAVIAPSFADIFYNNCFKNGLLPVTLPAPVVRTLMDRSSSVPGYTVTVDLMESLVTDPEGLREPFRVDEFRRCCLLEGLDDIGLTLRNAEKITAFEAARGL